MEPVIKSKKGVIVKDPLEKYDPETFNKFKQPNFIDTDDPDELLDIIKPVDNIGVGYKYISADTETHPMYISSQEVPKGHVRRWVGTGKSATPQDYPFCLSICDGINAVTLYSDENDVEGRFAKIKKVNDYLLSRPDVLQIYHNAKFDMHMLANAGAPLKGRIYDTMTIAKLVNENRKGFSMWELADMHPKGITIFEQMVKAFKASSSIKIYSQMPRELMTQYANGDVWNTFHVFESEYPLLHTENVYDVFLEESQIMYAMYEMERLGTLIDMKYNEDISNLLVDMQNESEQKVYDLAGKLFNANSGKQLYEVLMDLGVDPSWIPKKEETGNPILDKDVLSDLARKGVEIVQHLLDYRQYSKLNITYAIGIRDQRSSDNTVHCSINQSEAVTGRMSITKPALQTLPKKDTRIRSMFIPRPDYELYFMDLDQVEYRLYAHYAKEEGLIEQIKNGYDVHLATASIVFNEPAEVIEKGIHEGIEKYSTMRSNGKTVNFALLYGAGIKKMAYTLDCTEAEAKKMKQRYFQKLPNAKRLINGTQEVIKVKGFVTNYYGRKRRLKTSESYKALNALIQGCAADYLKQKIILMYKYIKYNKLKTRMLLPVHDEIMFEVHKDEIHHIPVLRWIMSDFSTFRVPITAGVEKGNPSWGEKVEVDCGFEEPINKDYETYSIFDQ